MKGGQATIQKIPENILLKIFIYLPMKDRFRAGGVCKQWRRITHDKYLWKHVDLLECELNLSKMFKILRAHFSKHLQTLKIRGLACSGSSKQRRSSISNAMLKELSARCPNLIHLHIVDCSTDSFLFENLPKSITSLSITNSNWQLGWMFHKQKYLPNLESLNMDSCIGVEIYDLKDIAYWTNLKTLSLSGCPWIFTCLSIYSDCMQHFLMSLQKLESLNITGTRVNDLGVLHIVRHLKELKELFLAKCPEITDISLGTIAAGLPKLKVLDISHCDSVTVEGLAFLKFSTLEFLSVVRNVRLTEEEICALKNSFSHNIFVTA